MNYYAHTAEESEGPTLYTLITKKPPPSKLTEEQGGWQALKARLTRVAEHPTTFTAPFGLTGEVRLVGTVWHLVSIRRMP